jgi:transposase
VIAMEACGGAHHIGRFCLQKGHEPRLMPPLYVWPDVDDRDTKAIAEAATRPTMSFSAIKGSVATEPVWSLNLSDERRGQTVFVFLLCNQYHILLINLTITALINEPEK